MSERICIIKNIKILTVSSVHSQWDWTRSRCSGWRLLHCHGGTMWGVILNWSRVLCSFTTLISSSSLSNFFETSFNCVQVLKSAQPIIVYFPDSSLWLSRAVSKANRKEFVHKVQEMFDQLSGPVVLICGRNKVETGSKEKEKFVSPLSDLSYSLTF